MTIVNSWVEYADIFASVFVMLVLSLAAFVLVMAVMAFVATNDKLMWIPGIVVALLAVAIMTTIGIVNRPNTGKTKIECILDDTISANYIFDKYDFEDKRGDIYTLVEKEEDKQ